MKKITVLLDNGHGKNTSGKCSPDKRIFEYEWTRELVGLIKIKLQCKGIDVIVITPEETDISLSERCKRVNKICSEKGSANCALISVHINAAGSDGKWHDATGWSGWVSSKNASSKSKKLAQLLYDQAIKYKVQGNRSVPKDKYWSGNFAIVRDTNCPAVLTENMFMDNKSDVEFLLSEKGKETLADLHVDGLLKYMEWLGN